MKILKVEFENNMIAYGHKNDQEFAEYVFEIREIYNTKVKNTSEIENTIFHIDDINLNTFN